MKLLRQLVGAGALLSGLTSGAAWGQSFEMNVFNPLSSNANGVHLYGASVTTSYFSSAYGIGLSGLQSNATQSNIGMIQGGASFGWSKKTPKSSFSAMYSPSYVRSTNLSNYHSLNHSANLYFSRPFGRKWVFDASAGAFLTDLNQLMYAPTIYGSVSATQATFDELVGAVLLGRSDNTVLTQLIGAAPVAGSPESAYVYGDRQLSLSARMALSYNRSARSTYQFSANANRAQSSQTGNSFYGSPIVTIPKTTSGSADLSWSYSLTPRTTMGVAFGETRTLSKFQDAYVTHIGISVGHTLSRHWFFKGSVGMGVFTPVRETVFSNGNYKQDEWSGSVGYKLYAHTFLGSYSRSISDMYGLGAQTTVSSNGAWTWKRPGRSVSVSSTFGYAQLGGSTYLNSGSWSIFAGVAKALDSHVVLSASYRYFQYPQYLLIEAPSRVQTGVIFTVSWSPSARQ